MEIVMRFQDGKTKVSLTPNYDVTDHSGIDISIENIIDKDNSDFAYVSLKELEAEYLANEILRMVEMNRKDNVRWMEDEEKKNCNRG